MISPCCLCIPPLFCGPSSSKENRRLVLARTCNIIRLFTHMLPSGVSPISICTEILYSSVIPHMCYQVLVFLRIGGSWFQVLAGRTVVINFFLGVPQFLQANTGVVLQIAYNRSPLTNNSTCSTLSTVRHRRRR
jgi:hypothetical protein